MIAARQTKPIEGRMHRKQTFRTYSRNLHGFALNIISVPSYRQEGCLNVTQKTTIFSSSRCWQEKGLGFCCGFAFLFFFFLSLFQLSRSPLCPNRKLHGEVAALHYRKKPANGLQALAQSSLKPPAWLFRNLLLCGLHLSPPLTSFEEQKILDLSQSLAFTSVRTEPQNTSNQCCVANSGNSLPSGLWLVWIP